MTGRSAESVPQATPLAVTRPARMLQRGVGLEPPEKLPRRGLKARLGAVFGVQAVLHDLELQRADRRQQRHARQGRAAG